MKKLIILLLFIPLLSSSQVYELTYSYFEGMGELKAKGTLEIVEDKKIKINQVIRKESLPMNYDVELFFNENGIKKYTTPDKGDVSTRLTFQKSDMGKKRQFSLMIDVKDNFNDRKMTTIYYMIRKD